MLANETQSVVPGKYRVDYLDLLSSKLVLHFEREPGQNPKTSDIFAQPYVFLFQRLGSLDVQMAATKHTALDKNNSLDLELSTGWNAIKSCEMRVKPATGGLRLLTTEAKFVESSVEIGRAHV